jgi:lipopolysaccharide export system protein LptA
MKNGSKCAKEKSMNRALALCLLIFLTGAPAESTSLAATENKVLTYIKKHGITIESLTAKTENLPDEIRLIYETRVKVGQKKLTMTCDRLEIVWPKKAGQSSKKSADNPFVVPLNELRSMTASGNVRIIQEDMVAVSGKAEYDNVKRTITLQGGPPRLWQGPNSVVADTIVIFIDEKRVEMRRGKETEVKTLIKPEKKRGKD